MLSANILAHRYCTAYGLGTSPESPKSQEVLRRSRLLYRWILKWSILFRRVVLHARQASVLPHEDRSAVQDFTSDIFPVRSESDGFRLQQAAKQTVCCTTPRLGLHLPAGAMNSSTPARGTRQASEFSLIPPGSGYSTPTGCGDDSTIEPAGSFDSAKRL